MITRKSVIVFYCMQSHFSHFNLSCFNSTPSVLLCRFFISMIKKLYLIINAKRCNQIYGEGEREENSTVRQSHNFFISFFLSSFSFSIHSFTIHCELLIHFFLSFYFVAVSQFYSLKIVMIS